MTGRLLYPGQAGRLNSATYMAFLKSVLADTLSPISLIQDGARYHTRAETSAFFDATSYAVTMPSGSITARREPSSDKV